MRPIKFRAWDKDTLKMYYDICRLHFNNGKLYAVLTWENDSLLSFEIMQFTGLHDKNGREIWEGDVVNWCGCPKGPVEMGYYEIIAEQGPKCWKGGDIALFAPLEGNIVGDCEVVGNIFENPELLETK